MIQTHRALAQRNSGFSLVELLVAAVVMAISSMGGTYLFNQARAISQTLEQQFAISNELAVIRDHNDRYSCARAYLRARGGTLEALALPELAEAMPLPRPEKTPASASRSTTPSAARVAAAPLPW